MQGKTLNTILLAIIAVLTLAVAVLVIFLFTTINAGKPKTDNQTDKPAIKQRVVPIDEQAEFYLYSEDKGKPKDAILSLKGTEEKPNSFLMTSISVTYDAGEKNKLLEKRKLLLEQTYIGELRQATMEYFRSKSVADLNKDDAVKTARDELITIFNGILSKNPDEKIIINIVFENWIIQ